MRSEQVKKIVSSLHGTKDKIRPLKITFDNMFVVDEQKDVILWDDENELVTIILPVDDYQRQTTTPIGVKVFSYEEVQKIEAFFLIMFLLYFCFYFIVKKFVFRFK